MTAFHPFSLKAERSNMINPTFEAFEQLSDSDIMKIKQKKRANI